MTADNHTPVENLFDLSGKKAVVTGASRGIGEAIARRLVQHGADVVVSSRKIDACRKVVDEINEKANRDAAHAIACDISRKEDVQNLVDQSNAHFGRIDILIANAAVNPFYGSSADISDEHFDKILTSNVKSTHWLSQMVRSQMIERKDGAIVIISSIGAFVGSAAIGAYNVSKAADLQIARNLAVELGPHNIRVNCICPGVVKTYFAEALWKDPKMAALMTQKTPMRRFGEPDDIAGAAVFLASPAAAWMTGQHLVIDGGTLIGAGDL